MQDSISDKLRLYLLHRLPLLLTLLLMFIFYVPLNSQVVNYFRPSVGVIGVYYWTLKRGYIFSYASAFIVGFMMDVYSSSPLGMNILLLMLLVLLTHLVSSYFKVSSFGVDWAVFAVAGLCYVCLKWFLFSVYFSRFLPFGEIFVNLISTIMFYPFIAAVNVWVQKNLLPQERINE